MLSAWARSCHLLETPMKLKHNALDSLTHHSLVSSTLTEKKAHNP